MGVCSPNIGELASSTTVGWQGPVVVRWWQLYVSAIVLWGPLQVRLSVWACIPFSVLWSPLQVRLSVSACIPFLAFLGAWELTCFRPQGEPVSSTTRQRRAPDICPTPLTSRGDAGPDPCPQPFQNSHTRSPHPWPRPWSAHLSITFISFAYYLAHRTCSATYHKDAILSERRRPSVHAWWDYFWHGSFSLYPKYCTCTW